MRHMSPARPGETTDQRLSRLQRERIDRALTEEFAFQEDSSGLFHWCFSVASGKYYRVDSRSCSCLDWQHRAGPQSLACKHQSALILRQKPEEPTDLGVRCGVGAAAF